MDKGEVCVRYKEVDSVERYERDAGRGKKGHGENKGQMHGGKAWVRARLRRIWYVVRTGQGRGKRFEQRGLGARGGYGVISKGVE